MMSPEDQLGELLVELQSLHQRAKAGERGRLIVRDVRVIRRRLETVEESLDGIEVSNDG